MCPGYASRSSGKLGTGRMTTAGEWKPNLRRWALFSLALAALAFLFCLVLCGSATAESHSHQAEVIQDRFLAHFESQGYAVQRNGYGHPNLERNMAEDGGSEKVTYVEDVTRTRWVSRTDENGNKIRTKTTKVIPVTREYTRSLGWYSGHFYLDLNVSPFNDATELATYLTGQTFPRMQRERLSLEERAERLGTVLNQPGRTTETRWPEADGYMEGLRIHENTQVFQESEEGYLYGELSSLREPAMTARALGKSHVEGNLNLVFWTDKVLFNLWVVAEHGGSGNLEGKADGGPRAMDLVREAYTVITGKELVLSLPDSVSSHPALVLEASPSSMPADGRSTSTLTVTFRDTAPDLLEGQELTFEILPEEGHVPGSLSSEKFLLGGDDPVSVTFTAPDVKTLPDVPEKATVRVSCSNLGLEDSVSLVLERYEGLKATVEYPVLPAHPDYYSALTFSFGAPGENETGKTCDAVIRAVSPGGRLLTAEQKLAGEDGSLQLTFAATPGAENTVYYHYIGAPPQDGAVAETVIFEVPERDYRQDVSLSVGIDLALVGVVPLWSEALTSGVAVPFRVRVEDRFHPDANLKELLDTFDVKPDLRIIRKSFVPTPVSGPDDGLCSRLLHHVTGSVIPRGATVREVTAGAVLRGKGDDSGWYLAETSPEGGSFFPGIIPWDTGSYQFEATLEPRWNGDATETSHSVVMAPLDISRTGAGEAMMDDFFIPTLKSWVGLTPGGSAVGTAWDVAGAIHDRRDNLKDAALAGISALASSVAQDLVSGWAGDAVKARLLKGEFRAHVSKAMDIPLEKLDDETFEKAMKAVGDRYWAGSTFDALFGFALEKAKGTVLPDTSGLHFVGPAFASGGELLDDALTFGSAFLKGQGGAAVLVIGPGADKLTVRDGDDRVLEDAPGQMFVPGDELQRVYRSAEFMVIPVREADETVLELPAGAEGLNLYRLRGDGHSFCRVEGLEKVSRVILSNAGIVAQDAELPDESLSADMGAASTDRSIASAVPDRVPGKEHSSVVKPESADAKPATQKREQGQEETGSASADERGGALQPPFPSPERVLPDPVPAAITGNRVNFRSEPTVSGKVLGKLDKGERVEVLKEWTPPSLGEGVLTEACEIEVGGETLHLPNGFGVSITAVNERNGTVTISFLHRGEKVSGSLARSLVSSTKGTNWFRVRRQDGTEGWAFGKYVDPEEGPPPGPGTDVQYLYYQALDLVAEEKDGEALFRFDQVLELYPAHVDALFERGRCLAAMKRYEEALQAFWEIPFYAPSQPFYLAWTGYCYQAMKHYDKALLAYGAALKLHPLHDIVGPVSDHMIQCQKFLNLPQDTLSSEEDVKGFIFGRWGESIAEEIWKGSTRGKGLWDTW